MANKPSKAARKFDKLYEQLTDLESVVVDFLPMSERAKYFRDLKKCLAKISAKQDYIVRYACKQMGTIHPKPNSNVKDIYQALYVEYRDNLVEKVDNAKINQAFYEYVG